MLFDHVDASDLDFFVKIKIQLLVKSAIVGEYGEGGGKSPSVVFLHVKYQCLSVDLLK